MRLLVTRPREDAESLAALLRAAGHVPVIAPIMEVRVRPGPPLGLESLQAVIVTSANGVRALSQRSSERHVTVYAVGPQTAETAREAGFSPVHSAEGDSAALVEMVAAKAVPQNGALLHAAGAETAGRLRQALQARGFTIETAILYEAAPVAELPEAAQRALRDGALDGVLLFSPRSAKTFAALVAAADLAPACARLDAFCISAATAAALPPLAFARVAVAGVPNQEAILALIPPPVSAP